MSLADGGWHRWFWIKSDACFLCSLTFFELMETETCGLLSESEKVSEVCDRDAEITGRGGGGAGSGPAEVTGLLSARILGSCQL